MRRRQGSVACGCADIIELNLSRSERSVVQTSSDDNILVPSAFLGRVCLRIAPRCAPLMVTSPARQLAVAPRWLVRFCSVGCIVHCKWCTQSMQAAQVSHQGIYFLFNQSITENSSAKSPNVPKHSTNIVKYCRFFLRLRDHADFGGLCPSMLVMSNPLSFHLQAQRFELLP